VAHPPSQPGWIDRPHQIARLGDLQLESGQNIRDAFVSYVVHGDLRSGNPVVLALSAIGSTHHRLDFLIGSGKAFDPTEVTVIAVDALGNGLSVSPSNSDHQSGAAFPRFSIRDMVASQSACLDMLGVGQLHAVVGASMGGMQALQWAVSAPLRMRHVVAMTPMARTAAWALVFNATARKVLQSHPGWEQGAPGCWDAWVPLMQMLCSRTPRHWDQNLQGPAEVEGEIELRTTAWQAQGFSPMDWVYQSWAYDQHDVGDTPGAGGDTAAAMQCVQARTLIFAPPLDLYNPVESARWAAAHIAGARFVEIPSEWGHQAASAADASSGDFLNRVIKDFLR
jgi:homoserine O-acetyltransferase